MKKLILILIITALAISYSAKKNSSSELGKRYLTLSNTYREANDFDKANDYVEKSLQIFTKAKDNYWLAKSYESQAFIFRDKSNSEKIYSNKKYFLEMSLQSLNNALVKLQSSKDKYKDSKQAIANLTKQIEDVNNKIRTLDFENDKNSSSLKNEFAVSYDNSKLKKIPEAIPSRIKYLSMAKNNFNEIPNEVFELIYLEYLDFSYNKLKEIPEDIQLLEKLKVLRLNNNKLKNIPNELMLLKNLKILDVSNNSLKKIPNTLLELKQLDILDIRGNKFKFDEVKKLLQALTNTQILHDEYILKPKSEAETGLTNTEEEE